MELHFSKTIFGKTICPSANEFIISGFEIFTASIINKGIKQITI